MKRSGFLKGAAGGLLALKFGKLPQAEAATAVEATAATRIPGGLLVSTGGLCAPLSPIYPMPLMVECSREQLDSIRPICQALPSFQATRGGVKL